MRFIDPTGNQAEGDEEENKEENIWNKFLRFIGLLSEVNNKYAQPEMENDIDMLANSEEMKGAKIIALEVDKAKKKTVEGIDYIHDVASTTSGAAAGISLLTIYEPQISGGALTVSMGAGIIAGSASFASYLITGKSSYGIRAAFEFSTLGIGAISNSAVKAGKTLTPENVIYLRNTIGGGYGSFMSGTSIGFGF